MSHSTSEHWVHNAMDRAAELIGETADLLDGKPLGIAADYLEAASCYLTADGDDVRKRLARRLYLNTQAADARWKGQVHGR